jgi:hypothetical protein
MRCSTYTFPFIQASTGHTSTTTQVSVGVSAWLSDLADIHLPQQELVSAFSIETNVFSVFCTQASKRVCLTLTLPFAITLYPAFTHSLLLHIPKTFNLSFTFYLSSSKYDSATKTGPGVTLSSFRMREPRNHIDAVDLDLL